MNQQDFIKQFKKVHGRKPSPAELHQAIQEGRVEVTSRNLLSKRLFLGLGIAVLGVGGFCLKQALQDAEQVKVVKVTPSKQKEATSTSKTTSTSSTSRSSSASTTAKATSTSSTSSSSSTSTTAKTTETTSNKMDIEALYKRDLRSVQGEWTNGQDTLKLTDKLVGDVEVMQHEDGYVEYIVTETGVRTSRMAYFFFPAGTPTIDLAGAQISNQDDTTKDRVLVMSEMYGSFYYRADEKSDKQDASVEGVQAQIKERVNQYRKDINRSLATRTDAIADNFVKGSESHRITVDWVVNDSANEGIARYDSTTDSISNIQVSGNTVTCDISYTTITSYTDGRSPATGHSNRHYVFEKTATGLLIKDFGGLIE
ncbi:MULTISPECIES: hypothetical protein [unclassified Streptococcus]|uniref:hypothetical protein n=1 Tax=unclassified Streptococcus TaxID=2608887 RepID=UPI002A874CDE|nr:hypothetical protein [Streptococcus sp.]MDY3824358.1 hypothetical protein [Streptococcus sp.]